MHFELSNSPKWLDSYVPRLNSLFDKYFENLLGKGWISVNFVDKAKIEELNHNYKKHAHATDVLSFPYVFIDSSDGVSDEEFGEVYVCEEVVKENAKDYGVTMEEEVIRVLIHGSLHVLGYQHRGTLNEGDPADKEMFDMQEFLVKEAIK